MKKINLSNGGCALVDDNDFDELNKYNWFSYSGYAYRAKSRLLGNRGNISMHVHLLGKKSGLEIDHINGNRLDNRRENLRFSTRSQNQANKGVGKNNTSGYKGVSRRRDGWSAQIKHNGKQIYIGTFKNPEDAARAYDKKAVELHGIFATVNFDGGQQ